MHVLFVGPFPWPSHQGSQAYLASQVRALVAAGHRVSLAVYGGGEGGAIPGVRLVRGRPGARFSSGGLHWSRPLADLGLVRAMRALHRTDPVDLIHAHQVEGPLVARLARLDVPIVYDLHTSMAEELGDHVDLGRFTVPLGRAVDRLALRAADAGCAISRRSEAIFARRGLPCRWIPPSIDPSELEGLPTDPRPRLVYTGNLDAYQDLDLLWAIRSSLPLPLVVVTGSDEPVPDGVEVVRSRDPQDALRALAGATAAIVPRRHVAGFPIKLLNQLGLGVPTVVMRSARLGVPGLVETTPGELSDCIRTLVDDPERRERLGREGRSWVREQCTPSAQARGLEALYRELLVLEDRQPDGLRPALEPGEVLAGVDP